jgi:hypothetical protein
MKQDTEQKITVEDLLRLKRAERPPAEFWATFESEIRAKQLSAIVSKRPWWDSFSTVFTFVNRHQLSFGGAAALALTFASVRFIGGNPEPVRMPRVSVASPVASAVIPTGPAPEAVRSVVPVHEVGMETREAAPAPRQVVTTTASHITQAPTVVDAASRSPFSDGLAITLADFREPASDFSRPAAFGSDREFESVAPARQQISDPLARMDPAAERRARLLSPALPAYSPETQRAMASDWMKRRASSDDRMYESMDRPSDDRTLVGFRF